MLGTVLDARCKILGVSRKFRHAERPQAILPMDSYLWIGNRTGDDIMPLYEIETDSHIIITWAADEQAAREVVKDAYNNDAVIRLTKRPRDTWVISKGVLGLTSRMDICGVARDCLAKSSGDKLHAIRLYMHETGSDLEKARKVIESNMVMGW